MRRFRLFSPLSKVFAAGIATGMFVTIASAALNATVFADVQPGSFYEGAVRLLNKAGVIKGFDDGKFRPNDYVTRGQIAVLLQRFEDYLARGGKDSVDLRDSNENEEESEEESSSSRSSASNSSASIAAPINNPKGTIRFTTTAYTVGEKNMLGLVSIVRVGGKEGAVSVKYSLSDGTAKAGDDYEAATEVLNFGPNETSKTFNVKVKDNAMSTGNKTITLTLSDATGGASLGTPSTATMTILDDEAPASSAASQAGTSSGPSFAFSALTYGVYESKGGLSITVQRLGSTTTAASVAYYTTDGSAYSGTHYTSAQGTLDFAAGDTAKTFTLNVTDNVTIDGNRNLTLGLKNPTGGLSISGPSSVSLSIIDDETLTVATGSFRIPQSSMRVSENDGKATVTITRIGGANGTASVGYATTGGSAAAGSDYTSVSGTLTFQNGELSKSVVVPVLVDSEIEGDETINFNLSSPTNGAGLGDPSSTVITIGGTGG